MKRVAILQSNYLPWKGVFDMINQVDIFVFLEDVQYTKRDWRNRNKILSNSGSRWITVPVKNKGRKGQLIQDVRVDISQNWQYIHYNTFQMNYGRAPYFKKYKWIIEDIYMDKKWVNLSKLNIYSTKLIAKELGINTEFIASTSLDVKGTKDDRLIAICKKLNADYYLSGPAAKDYIISSKFEQEGLELDYIKYEYPKYKQLHEPFTHYVTILDLIFNVGPDAPYYIWGWRENRGDTEYDIL